MGTINTERIIAQASKYVGNINKSLKNIKFEIFVDYIQLDSKNMIITTNKVVASSDLNTVKKYIKDLNDIDSDDIISPRLP